MFDWHLVWQVFVKLFRAVFCCSAFRNPIEMSASNSNHDASADNLDAKRKAFVNGSNGSLGSVDMLTPSNSVHKAADYNNKMSSVLMRRSESFGHMKAGSEAHVLVIYTGGTIGMVRNENNG